jgi:WD40 repeat protein
MKQHPYKFLDAYTKDDGGIFFGREQEIDEICSRVSYSNILLVYGASGSGKTSILQCGVRNKFNDTDWKPIFIRRKENIVQSIHRELEKVAMIPLKESNSLANKLTSIYLDYFIPIYLIFDQFEELFIFGNDDEKRKFVTELLSILKMDKDIHIILSIREEYLANLSEFEEQIPYLFDNRIRIERINKINAVSIIEKPCESCDIGFEAGLSERIIEGLVSASGFIELTYLQVLMDKLCKTAGRNNADFPFIHFQDLKKVGTIGDLLSDFLEEQISAMENAADGECILKAMISSDGTKRSVNIEELINLVAPQLKGITGDKINELIQYLIKVRIVSEKDDQGCYELRHDSLAKRIYQWLTTGEKDVLQIKQLLENRYLEYEKRKVLLDKETIEYIEPYKKRLHLASDLNVFIDKSIDALEKEKRKKKNFLISAVAACLIVLLIFTGWNYIERKKAQDQEKIAKQQLIAAKNNLGSALLLKGELALKEKDYNRLQLYSMYALKYLKKNETQKRAIAGSNILSFSKYPVEQAIQAFDKDVAHLQLVHYLSDGNTLASGNSDGSITLWDITSGDKVLDLKGHEDSVNSLYCSPNSKILASGSSDMTIKLWDISTGTTLSSLEGHLDSISSVAFSPNGKILASGSSDNTIKLWDLNTKQEISALFGHAKEVSGIHFSPDSKFIASSSNDKTIKLWQVNTGELIFSFEGHSSWINSVSFSPDGKKLASGSFDGAIILWDLTLKQKIVTLEGHSEEIVSMRFSPDGRLLASGSSDHTVKLWDAHLGEELATLSGHSAAVKSVDFSPSSKVLASASADNTILFWDISKSKKPLIGKHSGEIHSISYSPTEKILAAGGAGNVISLWDFSKGKIVSSLSGHEGGIYSITYSSDGKLLASGSADNKIKIWNTTTGKEIRTLSGHLGWVMSVDFSPDGKYLASGSDDKSIKIWDINTGTEINTFKGHTGWIYSVKFSPDGNLLASGSSDKNVKIWNLASGMEILNLSDHAGDIKSVSFSPDGKTLASGSADKTIKIWKISSGKQILNLTGHKSWINNVKFSPDGKSLVSASNDTMIKLWELSTGNEVASLVGHTYWVNSVDFSPDGNTLASGSSDKTLRLWDLAFIYKNTSIENQIQEMEKTYRLKLDGLDISPKN